jgi:hypothetical protein
MAKPPYTPQWVKESKTTFGGIEEDRFIDALFTAFNADAMAVHYREGTITIYSKPRVFDRQPMGFTIYIAPPDQMNEKIKELIKSKKLFDEFIQSKQDEFIQFKQKETIESNKIRSKL